MSQYTKIAIAVKITGMWWFEIITSKSSSEISRFIILRKCRINSAIERHCNANIDNNNNNNSNDNDNSNINNDNNNNDNNNYNDNNDNNNNNNKNRIMNLITIIIIISIVKGTTKVVKIVLKKTV